MWAKGNELHYDMLIVTDEIHLLHRWALIHSRREIWNEGRHETIQMNVVK